MEVLRAWLGELGLSRPVVNFEEDLCNGYLLGEVLHQHGLLSTLDLLQDKESPAAKVGNFTTLQQPLLDLGVKFNSKIANELMTERKGAAINLCYQLKLGLENAKQGGGHNRVPVMRRGKKEPVLLGSTVQACPPSPLHQRHAPIRWPTACSPSRRDHAGYRPHAEPLRLQQMTLRALVPPSCPPFASCLPAPRDLSAHRAHLAGTHTTASPCVRRPPAVQPQAARQV